MSGTGFLDGFKPKKGNFEPSKPTKVAKPPKKAKKGKKAVKEPKQPVLEVSSPPPQPIEVLSKGEEKAFPDSRTLIVSDEAPPVMVPEPEFNDAVMAFNPSIQRMLQSARNAPVSDQEYILCGIAGPPKSGKTGQAMDSLTDEDIANGAELVHVDFDMGGASTRAAHHADKANHILVLNPWIVHLGESRETYDFPDTFQQVLDILKGLVAQAEYQNQYRREHGTLPKPYLKTVIFDGVDNWAWICETLMKIEDLELGRDGIDAAAFLRQREKGGEKKKSVSRFNWNLRKIRYQLAFQLLRELCRAGVHCYAITHMKQEYAGNDPIPGSGVPAWLDVTEGLLQQLIYTDIEEERNESGELTGISRAYGRLLWRRTSLHAPEPWIIFERNNEGGEWFGTPGMAQGTFGVVEE